MMKKKRFSHHLGMLLRFVWLFDSVWLGLELLLLLLVFGLATTTTDEDEDDDEAVLSLVNFKNRLFKSLLNVEWLFFTVATGRLVVAAGCGGGGGGGLFSTIMSWSKKSSSSSANAASSLSDMLLLLLLSNDETIFLLFPRCCCWDEVFSFGWWDCFVLLSMNFTPNSFEMVSFSLSSLSLSWFVFDVERRLRLISLFTGFIGTLISLCFRAFNNNKHQIKIRDFLFLSKIIS